MPFSSQYFVIGQGLEKVSWRAQCKARRWDKVITNRRVCIVQYRVVFSFHLAKRGIRAETEMDDIVPFSKVTTKSLASGTTTTLFVLHIEL